MADENKTVASLAAGSVKGVSGMVSSMSGGIAELLGKKNMSKGVKVSVSDKDVTLNLSIIVEYGAKIPDVAWEIQEKVKSEVEAMTAEDAVEIIAEKAEEIAEKAEEKVEELISKAKDAADKAEDIAENIVDEAAEEARDVVMEITEPEEPADEPEAE